MSKRFSLAILLSCALLVACTGQDPGKTAKLEQLFFADPIVDAKTAFAKGDFKFAAVHNHKLMLPPEVPACLVDKHGYFTLSNQNFKYMGYEFQQYGAVSQIYAHWYNYEMHQALQLAGEQC